MIDLKTRLEQARDSTHESGQLLARIIEDDQFSNLPPTQRANILQAANDLCDCRDALTFEMFRQ